MAAVTLDTSAGAPNGAAPITVRLAGVDQGNQYHFDFTPVGVAQINGGRVEAVDDGVTVLRTWPIDQADREGPIFAEATITVTGDAMTIEFGPVEPK